jgi:hypothetical protein
VIRYDIDFAALEQMIDAEHPTWRRRAAQAVERMRTAKPRRFDESGPSWSDIKHLYVRLQSRKCAYCERDLGGLIEHDVEHYRPKCAVTAWQRGSHRHALADGNARGYCMLAYELRNYCMACKTCNSAHKRDRFPIAGTPGRADARDIAKLNAKERPMIPYPLGRIDDDPEAIITFVGFLPVPRQRSGLRRRRAEATIELFGLDRRTELTQGRSRMLRALWLTLRAARSSADQAERERAREQIDNMRSGREPHTACARAFVQLFETNPEAARAVFDAACEHLSCTS